jgi:hypothetical protein
LAEAVHYARFTTPKFIERTLLFDPVEECEDLRCRNLARRALRAGEEFLQIMQGTP